MSKASNEDVSKEDGSQVDVSDEDTQPKPNQSDPIQRGQTAQMNPAMLGQAANMNPASDVAKKLDVASMLLENASEESGAAADLSIEEYMAALIARSQSPGLEADPALAATLVFPTVKPEAKEVEPPVEEEAVEEEAVEDPQQRRPATSECRDAISELRELANISARSSFDVHQGRQIANEMHHKLVVILVSFVVSFALASFARHSRSVTFFAAAAALIVGISWTAKFFQLGRELRRLCCRSGVTSD